MYYTCIACITIDSIMNIDKKIICKSIQKSVNRKKRKQMPKFIKTKLKSDLDSEKLDNELMTNLESGSDSE